MMSSIHMAVIAAVKHIGSSKYGIVFLLLCYDVEVLSAVVHASVEFCSRKLI
jgi:hypothetical protein